MPIIKSAQKQLRQDKKRTEVNTKVKSAYKDALRNVRRAASEGKKVSDELVQKAHSALDKASKKGMIHQNKASRLKSRMTKLTKDK